MEQRLIGADLVLDHLVVGQPVAGDAHVAEQLAGGLALGGGVVGAILGDHPGGSLGDLVAQARRIDGGTS